jgi:hypothetical protein
VRIEKGVIEVTRKTLGICTVLVIVAMLITPLIGTAQAYKVREPYHAEYRVVQIQPPTSSEVKGDYQITKGSIAQGHYVGPLGEGTMTAELLVAVHNTVTGKAWATLKNTIVIDSGPFGAGTVVGFTWFKYDNSPLPYDGHTILGGTGDLRGVSVFADKLPATGGFITEDGWIIHP